MALFANTITTHNNTMPHTHTISSLSATFDTPLEKHQISDFRKKVWSFVGMGNDLFHNHKLENGRIVGNLQRYPLIQFRTYKGCANIWAVNEGVPALRALVENPHFLPLKDSLVAQHDFEIAVLPLQEKRLYKLFGYVPFDKDNYRAYKQADTMQQRIALLEKVLTSHLVLFAYGVGWNLAKDTPIEVVLHDITHIGRAPYTVASTQERLEYTAFDVSFYVNMVLPDQAGIGNLKALGYGLLKTWEEINF